MDDVLVKVYSVKKLDLSTKRWGLPVNLFMIESELLYDLPLNWGAATGPFFEIRRAKRKRLEEVGKIVGADLVADAHSANWGVRREEDLSTAVLLDFGCSGAKRVPLEEARMNPRDTTPGPGNIPCSVCGVVMNRMEQRDLPACSDCVCKTCGGRGRIIYDRRSRMSAGVVACRRASRSRACTALRADEGGSAGSSKAIWSASGSNVGQRARRRNSSMS